MSRLYFCADSAKHVQNAGNKHLPPVLDKF